MDEKTYKWEPDADIVIKGSELSVLYQGVMNFMGAPIMSPMAILGVADASIVLKEVINRIIENGTAVEVSKETKNSEEVGTGAETAI